MVDPAPILKKLEQIVRSTPREDLELIANADSYAQSGDDAKHLAALIDLIESDNCRIDRSKDNSWFPLEPIELVAFHLHEGWERAFAACTAILMIDDIEAGEMDYMPFRWESLGERTYRRLPPELAEPILQGFAYLNKIEDQPPLPRN